VRNGRGRQWGSLLVDWSTAASIITTSAMVGIPGLRTFVHESQRAAVVNELQLEVRRAARTAGNLDRVVMLCAVAADGTCSGTADWSHGWIAFVDIDANGVMDPEEATDAVLWRTSNGHPNIVVSVEPAVLVFRPGFVTESLGQITVCDRERHGGARTIGIVRGGVPVLGEAAKGFQCA